MAFPLRNQTSISLLFCLVVVSAFQIPQVRLSRNERCIALGSNLLGPEDFDDGIGDINGGLDSKKDGEDLAKEFFRQQREREQTSMDDASSGGGGSISQTSQPKNNNDATPIPIDRSRSLFDEPAGYAGQRTGDSDDSPRKKFTGRRDDFTPQVVSSRSSAGQARSPREVMMEREYELVGRAERNLGLQAIFAVLALAFYIYIGATGGIVTGEAAMSDDFGGDDTIFFEEIMPVQRDSESSVWL
jgi:hypothetical protein